MQDNPLSYLDVSNAWSMSRIELSNTNLTSIDLSALNYMISIYLSNNDSLQSLDLKNYCY